MAKAKQDEQTIVKPVKGLRRDFQEKKDRFEELGWTITETAGLGWQGEKQFPGGGHKTVLSDYQKITDLFETIENAEKMAQSNNDVKVIKNFAVPLEPNAPVVLSLDISKVFPSPLKPQKRRRARFTDAELLELGTSILNFGLVNPITVRPVGENFEIVAGEQRWAGSNRVGLKTIDAIIKNLSDTAALEIQLIENLQRKDLHPMDEALWYQSLQEILKIDDTELSLRVSRPIKHVQRILKLNNLEIEVQTDLENNLIKLGHALEICLFTAREDQLKALSLCFGTKYENGWVTDKDDPKTVAHLKARIRSEILLNLSTAIFSLKDTTLRADNLPCTKCPQRTGAKESLFEDYHENKKDRCLNSSCFTAKTNQSIINLRNETSAASIAAYKFDSDYKIPIISWMPRGQKFLENIFSEKILVDGDYASIEEASCENADRGIFLDPDGGRFGKVINICQTKTCKTHKSRFSGSTSSTKKTDSAAEILKQQEIRLTRKEELFDIRIGEPVRRKVLKEAALKFDGDKTIFNHEKKEVYLLELLARLWELQCHYSEHTAIVIVEALGIGKNKLSTNRWNSDSLKEDIKKLSPFIKARLFFLLLEAHHDELTEGYSFKPQKQIKRIAKEFDIDYQLFDAEERFEQAPKKHKQTFSEYHQAVASGNRETVIPRMHSDKWDADKGK